MKTIIILAASALLVGCSSPKYSVNFVSDPPNALVTCSGTPLGYTPVVGYFDETKIYVNRLPIDCRATWVSGATATYPSVINTVEFPNGVVAVAKRPEGAANYTLDAQTAMQGAQQQEIERRRQAQQNQQEIQDMQRQLQNIYQPNSAYCYRAGVLVNCTTY